MMTANEIRSRYLKFFESKAHKIVASDSLVPAKDPTLLFTGAGMNQFKEQFIGKNITYRRAASSQKCLRTGDLGNVGKTSGHHTFFEMLGNFSFGDYFKKEACAWAWEFLTEVLKIPPERLWISVYKEDDEAYAIWKDDIRFPEARIVKMGAKDNFWPSNAPSEGPNGPCGPCSEIYYDWGKGTGCKEPECNPECNCGRFIEIWNLVFTQFNRVGVNKLEPLPSKNIDTGMGLERITAVMQGARTNFGTDLFQPIINELKKYTKNHSPQALYAMSDHLRAAVFTIADGVSPSNEERGYVVRKLIRRAFRFGNVKESFLYKVVPCVANVMGEQYPEIKDRREHITAIIKEEEEKFLHTLTTALPKLEEAIASCGDNKVISGSEIFKLVDTFGMPLEVIQDRCQESGYSLDEKGFHALMDERKELSRQKSKIEGSIFVEGAFAKAPHPAASADDPLKARVAFMARDKEPVASVQKGERVALLTDPQSGSFYTEAGGQVGDKGSIRADGAECRIINTYKTDQRVVHDCIVEKGSLRTGDQVTVMLDKDIKALIAGNHTATHLLHSALRSVLGEHVKQSGSLVTADRLRFDFTHMKKMTDREIERVEDIVNENIKKAAPVLKETRSRADAEKDGAMALFGEKYGETVRVVTIQGVSKELCGGTHVDNTGDIKVFKIIAESSIASGIRRMEAVTSSGAGAWVREDSRSLLEKFNALFADVAGHPEAKAVGQRLEASLTRLRSFQGPEGPRDAQEIFEYCRKIKPEISDALEALVRYKKDVEKSRSEANMGEMEKQLDGIIASSPVHNGAKIVVAKLAGADMQMFRRLSDKIKQKEKSVFIVLAAVVNNQANMIVTFSDDMKNKGLDASLIVKEASKIMGGSGGGRKEFAQAGGKDASKIDEALKKAEELFRNGV